MNQWTEGYCLTKRNLRSKISCDWPFNWPLYKIWPCVIHVFLLYPIRSSWRSVFFSPVLACPMVCVLDTTIDISQYRLLLGFFLLYTDRVLFELLDSAALLWREGCGGGGPIVFLNLTTIIYMAALSTIHEVTGRRIVSSIYFRDVYGYHQTQNIVNHNSPLRRFSSHGGGENFHISPSMPGGVGELLSPILHPYWYGEKWWRTIEWE
jgi:hypothetical protein